MICYAGVNISIAVEVGHIELQGILKDYTTKNGLLLQWWLYSAIKHCFFSISLDEE